MIKIQKEVKKMETYKIDSEELVVRDISIAGLSALAGFVFSAILFEITILLF
jgi:hypothetical protein